MLEIKLLKKHGRDWLRASIATAGRVLSSQPILLLRVSWSRSYLASHTSRHSRALVMASSFHRDVKRVKSFSGL